MGKSCGCEGEVKLGPWGIDRAWSYIAKQDIKQIIITYDDDGGINSIMFKGSHDGDHSTKFGTTTGPQTVKIDIDLPSEFLTSISGTYGAYYVCSLNFHTNKNQYGPFGDDKGGTPFSANAKYGKITGFHGHCGRLLYSIGVYIKPFCLHTTESEKKQNSETGSSSLPRHLSPPPSAAAVGGTGGRDWDDGVFAAVKGVHVRLRIDTGVISDVRFSYLKNDGSDYLSPSHGGDCGADILWKTILFCEKDEYLIGFEGFYGGAVECLNASVITSLSFITNKTKYGPFGAEIGTFFTSINFSNWKRKVVGFHGRSGAYLDAIGSHMEYL